jgi:hypothetical protein
VYCGSKQGQVAGFCGHGKNIWIIGNMLISSGSIGVNGFGYLVVWLVG